MNDAGLPLIEFWPDYGPGPLWAEGGQAVAPEVVGVPLELADRLNAWNSEYEEDKLPLSDEAGDPDYLNRGIELLAETRGVLGGRYEVVVTEPWWGEAPQV